MAKPIKHHVLLSDFRGDVSLARGALQSENWRIQFQLISSGVDAKSITVSEIEELSPENRLVGFSRTITYEE